MIWYDGMMAWLHGCMDEWMSGCRWVCNFGHCNLEFVCNLYFVICNFFHLLNFYIPPTDLLITELLTQDPRKSF
jgi:hypothetical protein